MVWFCLGLEGFIQALQEALFFCTSNVGPKKITKSHPKTIKAEKKMRGFRP